MLKVKSTKTINYYRNKHLFAPEKDINLEARRKSDSKCAVAALILDSADNILLLLRNKSPEKGCWTLPGGKLNYDEDFYTAIRREVKEETGLAIDAISLLTITEPFDNINNEQWFTPVFLVNKKNGIAENLEPESHLDLSWFPLSEIPNNINTTTSLAIEAYLNILNS